MVKSQSIVETLAVQNPDVAQYRADLAEIHMDVFQRQIQQGGRQAAIAALEQAETILRRLVADDPADRPLPLRLHFHPLLHGRKPSRRLAASRPSTRWWASSGNWSKPPPGTPGAS